MLQNWQAHLHHTSVEIDSGERVGVKGVVVYIRYTIGARTKIVGKEEKEVKGVVAYIRHVIGARRKIVGKKEEEEEEEEEVKGE